MVRIEFSLVVERPAEEVFAYLTDPERLPEWQAGVLEARKESSEPMGVGTRMQDVRTFLGRKIDSTVEVTAYDPPKVFGLKTVTGPVPFEITHTLEAANGGTRITFRGEGEPGGFFKLAEPIVARTAERRFKTDFETLKELVEAGAE